MERRIVTQRSAAGLPRGQFDLDHLRAIHRWLFQDIYDWAGDIRTVEIAKDGHRFQFRRTITTGMADVYRRLVEGHYLQGLTRSQFAAAAGEIIGDVNDVHPFREGNGRTQVRYLEQLAQQAGHPIDLALLDPAQWLAASRAAHRAAYELMGEAILQAIQPP